MDSPMEKENFYSESTGSPFSMRPRNQKLLDFSQMMDVDDSPARKSPWLSSIAMSSKSPLQDSPFSQFKVKKRRSKGASTNLNENLGYFASDEASNITPIRKVFADVNNVQSGDQASKSNLSNDDISPCGSPNMIKMAVQKSMQNPDLIGDFSKSCVLPVINGKHQDLKSITPSTVVEVLKGQFQGSFTLIDCRYPYEYEGGHIMGAKNLYTKENILSALLPTKDPVKIQESKSVLIFYCEFSSERGPGMYRFLRGKDRELNTNTYPLLYYPEMYILNGGYKEFYSVFKEYCEPLGYKTMLDKNHTDEMAHFRSKCKSDNNNRQNRRSRTKARAGLIF